MFGKPLETELRRVFYFMRASWNMYRSRSPLELSRYTHVASYQNIKCFECTVIEKLPLVWRRLAKNKPIKTIKNWPHHVRRLLLAILDSQVPVVGGTIISYLVAKLIPPFLKNFDGSGCRRSIAALVRK